jgi:hypothetical protein
MSDQTPGGAGKICSDIVGGVVDMALHPVETVGMAWEGLFWMGGAMRDVVGFVHNALSGGELSMNTLWNLDCRVQIQEVNNTCTLTSKIHFERLQDH